MRSIHSTLLSFLFLFAAATAFAQSPVIPSEQDDPGLRDLITRYSTDRSGLGRRYNVQTSQERRERMRGFLSGWKEELEKVDFDALGLAGRVDYLLMDNHLDEQLALLAREEDKLVEANPLLPFSESITALQEDRRAMTTMVPQDAAEVLHRLAESIEKTQKALDAVLKKPEAPETDAAAREAAEGAASSAVGRTEEKPVEPLKTTKTIAHRASGTARQLQRTLKDWYEYYAGYDPLFTWWNAAPYKKVDEKLTAFIKFVREKIEGVKQGEDEPIIGDPIGREELLKDLQFAMIPYTPEELVELANAEFAWCDREMLRASRELGFGDDWHAALEMVKNEHVDPGAQPDLIRDLAEEAIRFVEENDLVTVPPLAKEIWRIEMMSPERQKESPFFLGGEVIQVSFPTDSMAHEDKLMSMRGNNRHFSKATVHHELIPGHHLQGFMNDRYRSYRRVFRTPFWTEGWALYWEMVLWDKGFPETPQDRIGFLFWRMHRCARIIFSLSFHLGTMTPQECVDFLVDRVGHERANAEAEVRRSFEGSYGPLYQAAYMLGALQFRALRRDLVDSGQMTEKDFHDAILQNGTMPVELVRACLLGQAPAKDWRPSWRFYRDP